MHLKRKTQNAGWVWRFEHKRKIANAKIYEDKRDLYCMCSYYPSIALI